jgi:tetratricopeptide (TPR) repeat protein
MSRRVLLLVALVVVLLGALWFARRPVVTGIKEWRASSLVSKAERLAKEGSVREAQQALTAAWQLGPKRLETLRRLMLQGRVSGLGDLAALTLLVFFHDDRLPADREDILAWSLDRGDPSFFDQLYPNLDEEAAAAPTVRRLHARKLAMQGRHLESIEEARALESALAPEGDPELSLLIAELLARLPANPVASREAKERLHGFLGHEDESLRLRAWRLLPFLPPTMRDPGGDFDPVSWVAGLGEAVGVDRVAAERMRVERLPDEARPAEVEAVARKLLGDPGAAGAMVRWYLEAGGSEGLLALPEDPFLADSTLFSSRLQALLEVGKFAEAKEWLRRAPKDFPESVSASLEAVFLRREGRASEALSAWRRVIDRADALKNYGECVSILRVAERFGEQRAIEDVVKVIVSIPPSRLPSSEQLEFLEARYADRPGEWLKFWREMLRARPGDAFATETVSFLELGEVPAAAEPAAVLARTERALRRFPAVPRFRATHALWLLRDGKAGEALSLLREADYNWNEVDPFARAAYAVVLRENGFGTESAAMAAGVRWNGIGPVRGGVLAGLLAAASPPAARS